MFVKLSNTTIDLDRILAPVVSHNPDSITGYTNELSNRAIGATTASIAATGVGYGFGKLKNKKMYPKSLVSRAMKVDPTFVTQVRSAARTRGLKYGLAASIPAAIMAGYPVLRASERRHFGKNITTPSSYVARAAVTAATSAPGVVMLTKGIMKRNKKMIIGGNLAAMAGVAVPDYLMRKRLIKKHA